MSYRDERGPRSLPSSLNQTLHNYALAASAAGVAILALTHPANAEIVYTPANIQFSEGVISIDLNHDGRSDVRISDYYFAYHVVSGTLRLRTPKADAAVGLNQHPSALSSGFVIGPTAHFGADNGRMARYYKFDYGSSYHRPHSEGNWRSVTNGYIGLRFQVGNETHYGWVRMSVTRTVYLFNVNITGYAYETVANQSIVAGQTSGGAHAANAELIPPDLPAFEGSGPTLGMLAVGAAAQPIWRREEDSIS